MLQDVVALQADTKVCCYTKGVVANDVVTSPTTIHSHDPVSRKLENVGNIPHNIYQ